MTLYGEGKDPFDLARGMLCDPSQYENNLWQHRKDLELLEVSLPVFLKPSSARPQRILKMTNLKDVAHRVTPTPMLPIQDFR